MNNERRNITINVLPQSEGAWHAIAFAAVIFAAAWAFASMIESLSKVDIANASRPTEQSK